MLEYEIKLGKDDFKKEKLVWTEKYLSPDLSFVTGVTQPKYHIEKHNMIVAENSIINSDSVVYVETENVQRQGFIIVKGKEYEVNSGKMVDYSIEKTGKTIDYQYLFINGKYYYWGAIPNTEDSGYTITNLLNYSGDSETYEIVENINVVSAKTANPIKIDTVYWIEDGAVTIDGHKYIYDKNEGESGALKYGEDGEALRASAITKCDVIEMYPYISVNDYEEVTKFKLTKRGEMSKDFSKISFIKYFYYVKYKEHYCSIKKKIDGDSYSFVCEIPKYVLSGGVEEYNLEPKEYELYFIIDSSVDDNVNELYQSAYDNGNKLNSSNYDKHNVKLLDEIKDIQAFIYVEEDQAFFGVDHDILNANDGHKIAVYLDDEHTPLNVGERVKFVNEKNEPHNSLIYSASTYNGVESDVYVIYNGNKYAVKPNLCDVVVINGNEYQITYINGKTVGKDCLVTIGSEKVPMKISGDTDGDYSSGTLVRYGRIISGDSKSAITASYSIKPYSGITVNGINYTVYENVSDDNTIVYATIGLPIKYSFIIDDIIGSSTYICSPYVNSTDFTDDFDRYISEKISEDVVTNQGTYSLYIQNKIFGEQDITSDLAFKMTETPISSDDYYNLFNDLELYVNNAYISIPISFNMNASIDYVKDEAIKRDFYEAEKRKAINPIVDMEKDVYMPKYIYGDAYHGSSTIFGDIEKIDINLHFRTRNLSSWKVNDGYNMVDTSGAIDNWFITDFHPYCDILKNKKAQSGETLMRTSDLMGLLYFTDDDIFYQRTKVSNSFLRLSFYDSTDPNTQSLLATSCVYMDGHALFKKYIDNSKKYERMYGTVKAPRWKENDSTGNVTVGNDVEESGATTYVKINSRCECVGNADEYYLKDNKPPKVYKKYSRDYVNVVLNTDDYRLSSRLTIDNKYATNTSSEGFYLYIFKEYSENLHPKPIYMKAEFNHAGIGKIIPFLIPMDWSGNTNDVDSKGYNKMYPVSALTLSNDESLRKLKEGFPLSYVYAQTYIPLYAVYDFQNKEYGYVFDSRYVKQDSEGNISLNLFEMKIKDESDVEASDKEVSDITNKRQIKAVININEQQFDKVYFNYETE